MSLLAAHFDLSGVTFYIQKGKKGAEIIKFPYVYSKSTLSNQCNKQEFYAQVIEKMLNDRGVKTSSCDILLCGFIDPPDVGIKTKYSIGIADVIDNSEDYIPIYLNNCAFLTKGVFNVYTKCGELEDLHQRDPEEIDRVANLSIYPNTVPQDMSSQTNVDEKITSMLPRDYKFESGRKIVFTGGRFSQNVVNDELNYILALDSLRGYGIFDIYLDRDNIYPILKTLQMYNIDIAPDFKANLENAGTFIRTGGATECLLSIGVGNDQFIEIEENKIFVLPLRVNNPAKLSIKSHVLGTIDIRTTGGQLGIVFDTRSGEDSLYSNVKIFNDCLKQLSSVSKEN